MLYLTKNKNIRQANDLPIGKYLSAIANIFTPAVITDLIKTNKSKYISEIVSESRILDCLDSKSTMHEFFDWIFNFISLEYRNEYVYKNVIANKILRGEHFPDSSYMLTELDAGVCKADVVILNGTSSVYEIKSEYDSLDRIDRQIKEYRKVFDKINIITCESQVEKLEQTIPNEIGLVVLTSSEDFHIIKPAKSNKYNVSPNIIINTLRKDEYLEIINKHYGYIPEVPNTLIYGECQRLFGALQPEIAHDEMVSVLSKRKEAKRLRECFDAFPSSLTAYIVGHNMDRLQLEKLNYLLRNSMKAVIGNN